MDGSTAFLPSRRPSPSPSQLPSVRAKEAMGSMAPAPSTSTPQQTPVHSYPPSASSSAPRPDSLGGSYGPDTLTYLIHTQTDGISDLRLQVSHEPSSSKQPPRPAYFRERALTENNEIVDSIIDATTGRTCWSVHRPTRGWYLHLRSPLLPPNTAISLRSPSAGEHDPSASPLTFAVRTRIRPQALNRVRSRIDRGEADEGQGSHSGDDSYAAANDGIRGLAIEGEGMPEVAVAATGREERKTSAGGHARRRSGATGSGSHAPDSRSTSKRPSSVVAKSPMIPEVDDERSTQPASSRKLPKLAIPDTRGSRSANGDRPYSPNQGSPSHFASDSAASVCHFLLTDAACKTAVQSWTRWACSILPAEIRPSVALDADKSFSLYWTDCPPGAAAGKGEPIEVVRFEDQSGRWLWNSHTRGRLALQTSAMHALGLQHEFWISAALAYIQFLEDKDAYEAARDA
ncbi:hypothetical protein PANT_9d00043 [Moesziomyces antarcticus T-34]|uniref:Uncharacterized protein n=1 Tax=Pseudozyma antarctica (strain T-34) TaxID=1151754 RepID=M9LNE6_PSEA3|nr:hypothetical protein PANT_9d00043 [Moesziomyces antarcticus T-34]